MACVGKGWEYESKKIVLDEINLCQAYLIFVICQLLHCVWSNFLRFIWKILHNQRLRLLWQISTSMLSGFLFKLFPYKLFPIASALYYQSLSLSHKRFQLLEKCWEGGFLQNDPFTHSFTLSPNHQQSPTSGSFHRNKTDQGLRWDNLSGVRDKRMTWFVGEIKRDKTRAVIKLIKATDTI